MNYHAHVPCNGIPKHQYNRGGIICYRRMQVFASHAQFKDWFSNPLTGMVEGQEAVNKVMP